MIDRLYAAKQAVEIEPLHRKIPQKNKYHHSTQTEIPLSLHQVNNNAQKLKTYLINVHFGP